MKRKKNTRENGNERKRKRKKHRKVKTANLHTQITLVMLSEAVNSATRDTPVSSFPSVYGQRGWLNRKEKHVKMKMKSHEKRKEKRSKKLRSKESSVSN